MQRPFGTDFDVGCATRMLTERQRRLLYSAIVYHALMGSGRPILCRVYIGESGQIPRLTDESTIDGSLTAGLGMEPLFSLFVVFSEGGKLLSHVVNEGSRLPAARDYDERFILLSPDDADRSASSVATVGRRPLVRVYHQLETSAPVMFDYVRELLRCIADYRNNRPITRLDISPGVNEVASTAIMPTPPVPVQVLPKPKAVIIAMYWLQPGGAERWGMETIRVARQQGLLPIVITDCDSQHPWITDAMCDEAMVLTLSSPIQSYAGTSPLLQALFERYDIKAVWVHHCQWMYDRLEWVKRHSPSTFVVDSLHILEYVMKGGYPRQAVLHDRWIDLHHVISPQLGHWLVDRQRISPSKVVNAPLIGLTSNAEKVRYRPLSHDGQMTVAFVGRMTRQKRPEAFVLLAEHVKAKGKGRFRFIMHGNGELDEFTDRFIRRHHVGDVVERRSDAMPVQATYADADVLVITSLNEGITLTTFESICAGIPVISADVGSQSTLIPEEGLLPRLSTAMVQHGTRTLIHLLESKLDRKALWQEEFHRLQDFATLESAKSLCERIFKQWSA